MINTIGPVWDGNEVWLLVAGGATFAAFPEWYATLFSGFYLPLLLILVALIVRGVAFEYRGKVDTRPLAAQLGPRHLLGLGRARAAVGRGLRQHRRAACRSNADHEYTGNLLHAAQPLRPARRAGHPRRCSPCTAPSSWRSRPTARSASGANALAEADRARSWSLVAAAFLLWTQLRDGRPLSWALTLRGRGRAGRRRRRQPGAAGRAGRSPAPARRSRWRSASLFATLYPDVMPSSTDPAFSLTIDNASSTALHARGDDVGRRWS